MATRAMEILIELVRRKCLRLCMTDSFRMSVAQPLAHGCDENERAGNAKSPGDYERRLRRNFPKQSANRRRWRDRQTAQQVIKPHAARSQLRLGEIYDHRLAGRLANFSEASNYERDNQTCEIVCGDNRQRIERKRAEGGDDEGTTADAVRSLRGRHVDDQRRGEQN